MKQSILNDKRYHAFCARYRGNLVRYVAELSRYPMTWQQYDMYSLIQEPGSQTGFASGHGCFGFDTEILMFDGSVKKVQYIKVGDDVMGDDSTCRNVISLCRGTEPMYRFEYMDGTHHIFNESHILCLVATQSHGTQISGSRCYPFVRDWLKWSDRKKRTNAIIRSKVEFKEKKKLLIPPYILGAWLGDGDSIRTNFTNPDREVVLAFEDYCREYGLKMRCLYDDIHYAITGNGWRKNTFIDALNEYGLVNNKHIPFDYLSSSYADRLELLAGILDTDGCLDKRSGRVFDISQKSEQLATDIVFLARSIGCHATIKTVKKACTHNGTKRWGEYYLVLITRNIEKIPNRVKRKKAGYIDNAQRANLHFGIRSVESLGEGQYYGFVLDGNQRFLGGDFTILHNTGKSHGIGWALDWHLRAYDDSNAMITATNIEQIRSVVWKELDTVFADVNSRYPWMADWFIKETKRYYVKGHKDSWYVIPKTASKAAPENIAGQHRRHYMCIVDEASGVEDEIIGVLRGALTHEDNRFAMFSQPTRQVGHFAEAFSSLKHIYKTMNLNAEESPIVSK